MDALTLLVLLTGWTPDMPHPPEFPFPQLPSEHVCEILFHQCDYDQQALTAAMEISGGWHHQRLVGLRCQNERLRAIWYAAWWITWSRSNRDNRAEWALVLERYIGTEAFWSGNLPLPLSLR